MEKLKQKLRFTRSAKCTSLVEQVEESWRTSWFEGLRLEVCFGKQMCHVERRCTPYPYGWWWRHSCGPGHFGWAVAEFACEALSAFDEISCNEPLLLLVLVCRLVSSKSSNAHVQRNCLTTIAQSFIFFGSGRFLNKFASARNIVLVALGLQALSLKTWAECFVVCEPMF